MKRIDISRLVHDNLSEEEIAEILEQYDDVLENQKARSREIRQAERLRRTNRRNNHESSRPNVSNPIGYEGPSNEVDGAPEEPDNHP